MTHLQPGTGATDDHEHEQARRFHGTLMEQLRITRNQLQSARIAARRSRGSIAGAADFRVGKLNRDLNELRRMIAGLRARFPSLTPPDGESR